MSDEIAACGLRVARNSAQGVDQLFATAYPELRRLAHARLYHGGRSTIMDTTSLLHESYLRLSRHAALQSADRGVFFAYASRVMRSVIVDAVRERQAQRRGGDLDRVTLATDGTCSSSGTLDEILQVHHALERLAHAEPRLAQVVEMRYFGGCSEAEIAQALSLNERTVRRDWGKARLLLAVMLVA